MVVRFIVYNCHLVFLQFLLILQIFLLPIGLWLVLLNLDPVLHLLRLYIFQFLGLDNVGEVAPVSELLELVQQVQFVLL